MANENKNFKARLIQKHETEQGWQLQKDFIPLPGEFAIYDIDEMNMAPRIKIGDGITTIENLPFVIESGKNTEIIQLLVGEDTNKSIRDIANEVFTGQIAAAPEEFDTLIEIATWLDKHSQDATLMDQRIKTNEDKLIGIGGENEPATVIAAIQAAACDLPAATKETLGGIKLSDEVGVNDAGQLEVKTLSIDKLINGSKEFVLNCGNATDKDNMK